MFSALLMFSYQNQTKWVATKRPIIINCFHNDTVSLLRYFAQIQQIKSQLFFLIDFCVKLFFLSSNAIHTVWRDLFFGILYSLAQHFWIPLLHVNKTIQIFMQQKTVFILSFALFRVVLFLSFEQKKISKFTLWMNAGKLLLIFVSVAHFFRVFRWIMCDPSLPRFTKPSLIIKPRFTCKIP